MGFVEEDLEDLGLFVDISTNRYFSESKGSNFDAERECVLEKMETRRKRSF